MSPDGMRTARSLAVIVIVHLAVIVLWQVLVDAFQVPKFVLPSPLAVIKTLGQSNYSWLSNTAVTAAEIAGQPGEWAIRAAGQLGVTVLLKGSVTYLASPSGIRLTVSGGTPWLATAGSGDVLAGILGALLATNTARIDADADALAALAATAVVLHGAAAALASGGGPIVALDIAEAVPASIAALLA